MWKSVLRWVTSMRRVVPADNGARAETTGQADDELPFAQKASLRPAGNLNPASSGQANGTSSEGTDNFGRRKSMDVIADHMKSAAAKHADDYHLAAGCKVTPFSIQKNLEVLRGPDWLWGEEDGGAGKLGKVCSFDMEAGTATVFWFESGIVQDHYRVTMKESDLCTPMERPDASMGAASLSPPHSPGLPFGLRNSQQTFSDKDQTAIIFDWDDTLFPSTYVRHDLQLRLQLPLKDQRIPNELRNEVQQNLAKCQQNAVDLLNLADKLGKVTLVTLARPPWVTDSCKNFYPGMDNLLAELKVKIVYAQDGVIVDHSALRAMPDEEVELFWGKLKGQAIAGELKSFYSRYEGQSWKNVISIGDSNFERLGTLSATEEYMRQHGILKADTPSHVTGQANVNGHVFKVRTKTFKMVDQPTIEELTVEVDLCRQWLPLMVNLDEGFDIDLSSLDDMDEIQRIEDRLRGPSARYVSEDEGMSPRSSEPSRQVSPTSDSTGPSKMNMLQVPR